MKTQELEDKSKLTKIELAILIVAATATITFVSTCSPLFPFNPWDDTNCFFTLGRGIIHGLIPYRDLYEQKGPLLYFIYALTALITEKSFIGAWIIECIAASVYAVFSWKIVKLFAEPSKFAIALMPLLLGVTYTIGMFNFGGNAEELCFPLMTVSFYFGLKAIAKGDGLPSKTEAFICGLLTGVLFWIKYTFIGFTAGFCIYILIIAIRNKSFAKLWSLVWRFVIGFTAIGVPILIYFAANGALNALWEAYFYNNIFLYHVDFGSGGLASIPVVRNIYNPISILIFLSLQFPSFGIMLLLTLMSLVFIPKEHRKKTILLFALTFAVAAGTSLSRPTFIYYYGYHLAYSFCLVPIMFVKGLNMLDKKVKDRSRFINLIITTVLLVFYIGTLFLNKNMYLFLQPKDSLAQYRIAETINEETSNAKVLTYDVMDSGFYTAAGIMPQNRFYCFLNIEKSYPAILEEQNRLIEEGYYDFIVTYYFYEPEWDNYRLIEEEVVPYVDYGGEKTLEGYKLYKRI